MKIEEKATEPEETREMVFTISEIEELFFNFRIYSLEKCIKMSTKKNEFNDFSFYF